MEIIRYKQIGNSLSILAINPYECARLLLHYCCEQLYLLIP